MTSNFWGTRFQIVSLNLHALPAAMLGEVVYKASLLHLQPRQMRLEIADMRDDEDFKDNLFDDWSDDDEDEQIDIKKGVTMRKDILCAVSSPTNPNPITTVDTGKYYTNK